MPKRHESVQVECQNGRPVRIIQNERTYRVQSVIECWIYQSRWWAQEGPIRRVYYRVDTNRGVLDLYRTDQGWTLDRVLD